MRKEREEIDTEIISINDWKNSHEETKIIDELNHYYGQLSFSQLIVESDVLLKEISVGKVVAKDLKIRTQALLNEFKDRIKQM